MFFSSPCMRAGPQNFWNCYKNLFKIFVQELPTKYFPCDWKQQSQCCSLCCKHCLISLTGMLSRAANDSHWTPAMSAKHLCFKSCFICGLKKVTRRETGRVGGWDKMTILFLATNCWTLKAVWAGALSWCRKQSPLCHFSGHRHHKLSCNCFNRFK